MRIKRERSCDKEILKSVLFDLTIVQVRDQVENVRPVILNFQKHKLPMVREIGTKAEAKMNLLSPITEIKYEVKYLAIERIAQTQSNYVSAKTHLQPQAKTKQFMNNLHNSYKKDIFKQMTRIGNRCFWRLNVGIFLVSVVLDMHLVLYSI